MKINKLFKFFKDNYFITIFAAIIFFTGIVAAYKLIIPKATRTSYIYAKVKLGQGLWWAGYNRPGIWFAQSIKKGDVEKDLLGRTIAQIIAVRYYPYFITDQYDVYITVKLAVSKRGNPPKYNFKRSTIGVGAPIELEFSSSQVTGTIIAMSNDEIKENLIEKQITLVKYGAYPWEYDTIKLGAKYFDGETDVFEVIDKKVESGLSPDQQVLRVRSQKITSSPEVISVKAKIKVKDDGGQLIFGEDQKIYPGKDITLSTPEFSFTDYVISEVK